MQKLKIILSILLIVIILTAFYFGTIIFIPKQIEGKIINIEPGTTAAGIADILYEKGIIRSRNVFYLLVRLSNKTRKLDFGKYLFEGNLSIPDVIEKIEKGKVKLQKVTIPEGLTLQKTCRLLEANEFGDYENYMQLCNDSLFAYKMTGFQIVDLEGFLYPDTYLFPENASEKFILTHLVKTFFEKTSELNFEPNRELDFYETIILASIVEREAKIEMEKPLIAGVYLNRLNSNHKLQADPTIAYALEKRGKIREKIYYKDLKIDSPYNTYRFNGLPPTPICSPSVTSISAVLEPADSDYFFFFADGTGGHEFSKTYSEHLRRQRIMKRNNGN